MDMNVGKKLHANNSLPGVCSFSLGEKSFFSSRWERPTDDEKIRIGC